jgi:hypothetical protein
LGAGVIDVNIIPVSQTTPTSGYTIHPAFTNTGNNGLGELEGIWVGKFESSSENGEQGETGDNIKIVPDVASWRNINISIMFTKSQAFAGNNSLSGYDSHMMKNTEWGAVAYFAHSKYGRNGTEVMRNNSSGYFTGRAGATISEAASTDGTYKYETTGGQLASTTGNIYGVYDMSGGLAEYVMGVINNTIGSSGFSSLPATKYYDNYTSYSNEIKGDAIYETSMFNSFASDAWFSDRSGFGSTIRKWFVRGRLCR